MNTISNTVRWTLTAEMRVVGLSGSIATGKSTVSGELSRIGITVIDCDKLARDATRKVLIVHLETHVTYPNT